MKIDISFKRINTLAVPALIAGIAEPIISITDTAIVGNIAFHATESLGAVAIVGTFISMLVWVFGQIRSAISSIISQYLGAHKLDEVKTLPAQAIILVVSASIILVVFTYPFARNIFSLYGASDQVLEYTTDYYKIRILGFPFSLFVFAVFGTFRGLQNTYYPMVVGIFGACMNVVLDWVLVYGIEGFIPAMNIKGAAYASFISQVLMAVASGYYLLKKTNITLTIVFPFNKEIKRLIGMVLNLFVRTIALNVALLFAVYKATGYGKESLAAYGIGIQLWFLGAFIIDGYSSAGNILSGRILGAKKYNTLIALSKKLTVYALYTGIILIIIGFLLYTPIGAVFTKDPLVLTQFYDVFWIIIIMQPFCAVTFIFDAIFKGMGKMRFLRNVLLFSTFFVFIPSLVVLDKLGYKLHAVWFTFFLWVLARGIPLIIKFRRTFLPLIQKS
ncbi:MAG: MATE family efflux transporter [Flavobacteriaceae bacterium]|nr:MAG: MATE family efflux transporter [Flavobacteriaceae bacterium]